MRHIVVVQQIASERSSKLFGSTLFEAHTIVDAGIVDQGIESIGFAERAFDCRDAVGRGSKINFDKVADRAMAAQLRAQILRRGSVAVQNHRDRTFLRQGACNSSTNPFCATGDDHDFIF